jgi:hypothetical protein
MEYQMKHQMRLRKGPRILVILALTGLLSILAVRVTPGSQAAPLATPTPIIPDLPHREISGDAQAPTISFIDSPSATCFLPASGTGACYIQWDYLYVTAASGSYVISMTVAIDNRIRAYHSGFFQSWMYIPEDMTAPGYKVACGAPGSGGTAGLGKTYAYTIRARETGGLSAANYGSVTCPADVVRVFLPLIQKR